LHGAKAINHILLDELHKVESHSINGPTAAFGAVIALAVTIARQERAQHWVEWRQVLLELLYLKEKIIKLDVQKSILKRLAWIIKEL
jgi:hypothetical protein